MNIALDQQLLLQKMLGTPKLSFERQGVVSCSNRSVELAGLVEAGVMTISAYSEPWGNSFVCRVTPSVKLEITTAILRAELES